MAEQRSRLVIEISSENAKRNAELLNRELNSIEKNGDYASKSMDSMSNSARQLAAQMAGIVTVGAAINKMDAYTNLQNRLKLVTTSQTELNKAMNDTFAIAQKTYSSWDSVIQVYQRLSDNAKRLKIDMAQTAALTETVSKAAAISGASTASSEAALMQFGQALASGVLRGEELNSIMEQTPALAKAIAEGMGITVGELRSVAAEGRITGDVLVKALTKASASVDELFSKTDVTIGQSITALNNEVTKFVGGAGQASGAATTLSSSIKFLADNLGSIADIALLGGVAYLTKAIISQTVAVRSSITASLAKRAAITAELQSQATLAAVEVQRARHVVALAATEVNLARAEFNSATTRNARAAATMRLTQAEIAYSLAAKQSAIATTAQTTAQNALNASQLIGSRLLALVGGPIGALTIGVTALAAGYMYFQKRADEANKKLEEQGRVSEQTKEKLLALRGVELDVAKDDLAASFADQNSKLHKLNLEFNGFIRTVKNANQGNQEVKEISDKVHKGLMSQADAVERLNKLKLLTPEQRSQGVSLSKTYNQARDKAQQNAEAQKILGKEVTLAGNAAQNASSKFSGNTKELKENKTAAEQAAQAQKDYRASLYDREYEAYLTKGLLTKGYSSDQVKNMVETANWARKNNVKITNELYQTGLSVLAIEQKNNKVVEDRNKAEKELTKEKEKQAKITNRLIGISGNSGIGTGAHLDVRYGGSLSGQKVSSEHLSRLNAGGKSLSSYKVSSDYGPRKSPTKGASSFHKGIDYAMPVGTPITTNVAVKDVKTAYDSKGGGYYSTVTFEDGVVLKLLHQSPKMVDKVKGGASGTKSNSSTQIDFEKEILSIQTEYNTEIVNRAKKREDEINQATLLGQKSLIPQINARYDAQDEIARLQLESELNTHKWTEEQKLQNTHDINVQRLNAEGQYSEQQKALVKKALDEQLAYELNEIDTARQYQIFHAERAYMHELDVMQERYRLERNEIAKIKDEKLKAGLLNASYRSEDNDYENKRRNIWNDLRSRRAEREGTTDYLQTDFAKESASKNVEDSLKYNLISEQEAKAELLKIEEDYQRARLQLNISYGGLIADASARSMAVLFGEQSGAYKAMFAVQKGFAIAQSALAIQQAMANAMSLPFPTNLAAVATVATETASILSNIQAVTMTVTGNNQQGYAEGGYTGSGGKYEPAGVVHKGEVVFSQADIARLGGVGVVEALRKGQRGYSDGGVVGSPKMIKMGEVKQQAPVINIHNAPPGTTATQNSDGSVDIDLIERQLANRLGSANSVLSKSLKQNTTASRRR